MFNDDRLDFAVVQAAGFGQGHSVIIRQGNDRVEFPLKFFEKGNSKVRSRGDEGMSALETLFKELQHFVNNNLVGSERREIFNVYKESLDAIYLGDNAKLQSLIHDLYACITLHKTHKWVVDKGIRASSSISEHFIQGGEQNHNRDRTYIVADYLWLAALALALRAVVPIWGAWFQQNDQLKNQWKDFYAFELLADSSLMTDGPDPENPATRDVMPPMIKLDNFVRANIPSKDDIDMICVMAGISTEEQPLWMLSMAVVRRVAVGDIGVDPDAEPPRTVCLVASTYQYVFNKFSGIEKTLGSKITDKKPPGNSADSETNLSRLESFRDPEASQAIDRVRPDVWASDLNRVLTGLMKFSDPEVNRTWTFEDLKRTANECHYSFREAYRHRTLEPVQRKVLTWVVSLVISTVRMDDIRRVSMHNLMAASQAFLAMHGHNELAGFLTAIVARSADGGYMMGPSSGSNRLDAAVTAKLRECYKNARSSTGRRNSLYTAETKYPIDDQINSTTAELKRYSWEILMPEHLCHLYQSDRRIWSPPADTKLLLAKLAIAIAERKF